MQMLPFPPWLWPVLPAVGAALVLAVLPLSFGVRFEWRGGDTDRKASFELSALGGLAVFRLVLPIFRIGRSGESPGLVALLGRAVNTGYRATRREATGQKEKKVLTYDRVRQAARGLLVAGGPVAGFLVRLAQRTFWHRITWTTRVGLGDAATTAILAGAVWGVKAGVALAIRRWLRLAPGQPEYQVVPVFADRETTSLIVGSGTIRAGHVVGAVLILVVEVGRAWLARRRTRDTTVGAHRRAAA